MKKIILLIALIFSGFCFAQAPAVNVNDYKYVVLPEKFGFLKAPNQYNLNSLTKMVFEKYGFIVFFTNDQMPEQLAMNKCAALYGDLIDDSGFLSTNLTIQLKDCYGNVVYTSEKGRSKIKEFKKAYYESLREASASLALLNYSYSGKEPVAVQQGKAPVSTQSPATAQAPKTASETPIAATAATTGQLFAQPIANGYQLVDTTPKVVVKMFKTSQQDYYTAQGDTKNGVIFKKGNDWFFEYYQNDKLVSEKLDIKF